MVELHPKYRNCMADGRTFRGECSMEELIEVVLQEVPHGSHAWNATHEIAHRLFYTGTKPDEWC